MQIEMIQSKSRVDQSLCLETKQMYLRTPQDLEIPANLASLVGPMTPRSVYCWYTGRVNQILSESCLFDNAVSLLELGLERLVPLKLYLVVIKLIEAAVCRLNFKVWFDMIPAYLSFSFPVSAVFKHGPTMIYYNASRHIIKMLYFNSDIN